MKNFSNILNISIADFIGSGASAIFWFYLATLIIPEDFGHINYFLSIVGITAYFSLVGTSNTLTIYVAKKIPLQSTFVFTSLIIGAIGNLILYFQFQRIDICLLVIGYIINNIAIGEILGKKEFKKYVIFSLTQKLLTPICGLTLFFIFGIDGIFYGLALSYFGYIFRIIKILKGVKIDYRLLVSKKGFIFNNYLISLSGTAHGQIDKILIMPILGAAMLGNYSLALQIITIMMLTSSIFYKYILPLDSSNLDTKYIKKIFILISIIISLIGFFIIPEILPIFFEKYTESVNAIRIMSLSIIPMSLSNIFISKFLSMEKSKIILFSTFSSMIILIVLMITLGKIFGILGIAISFVISSLIQTLILIIFKRRIDNDYF